MRTIVAGFLSGVVSCLYACSNSSSENVATIAGSLAGSLAGSSAGYFGSGVSQENDASDQTPSQQCLSRASDIVEKLACLDGVKAKEVTPGNGIPAGVRQFELRFTQPVDHNSRQNGTFEQRVVLLHRSESEPMVLQTSGYSIFGIREAAITRMFATNQIQVEHRYFRDSRPSANDRGYWGHLDIEQSARDFHAITVALKKIYPARWVNTGASKGGMTSVFHRWFFPGILTARWPMSHRCLSVPPMNAILISSRQSAGKIVQAVVKN